MKKYQKCLSLIIAATMMLLLCGAGFAPEKGKLAAMTFDDGPSAAITPKLLDELAMRKVKCTFFVLGTYANVYPETVSRAYQEGHQIASHTYNHRTLTTQSDYVIQKEVEDTRALLEDITGEKNFMVRLPYGDGYNSQRVLGYMNAPVILWSVDATNGKYPYTEDQLYRGILNQVHDGGIILMHDTSSDNMRAALKAIDTLQSQGYSFVTVEELFRLRGVRPQNNVVYKEVSDSGSYYPETLLSEHWAYSEISLVKDLGIMQGDGTGFKPNDYLTRAMAVTILWRTAGEPGLLEASDMQFRDVAENTWYSQAVAWGHQNKILEGYSPEYFGPDDLTSREQFCALITRYAKHMGISINRSVCAPVYSDGFRVSAWAQPGIQQIFEAGFVSLNNASIFRPRDSITRAEAAELISFLLSMYPLEADL